MMISPSLAEPPVPHLVLSCLARAFDDGGCLAAAPFALDAHTELLAVGSEGFNHFGFFGTHGVGIGGVIEHILFVPFACQ